MLSKPDDRHQRNDWRFRWSHAHAVLGRGGNQRQHTIEIQPIDVLQKRRILETTPRHELVHVLIEAIGAGQTPRWFTEGMALHIAGEGRLFEQRMSLMSTEKLDQALASAKSADEMRTAYAAAYNFVKTTHSRRR